MLSVLDFEPMPVRPRMSTAPRVSLFLAFASSVACTAPWPPLVGCAEVEGCTTDSSSGNDSSVSGGIETVTGHSESASASTDEASSSGGGSGSGGEAALPVEVELFLDPSPMIEAGEVQVSVWTSRPVTSIDLFLNNNDAPLVLGAVPASPVHVLDVTSDDVPGDGMHTIRAVVHAADGGSGEDEKALLIDVQPGGTDVWPPYVKAGPINGFCGATLLGNGIGAAGFFETNDGLEAVAVRIDGTTGQPEGEPVLLGPVAVTGGGRGPAIAAASDDAAFVAWTRPELGSTQWAVSRVKFGEAKGPIWTGPLETSVNAIAVVDDVLVLAGAIEQGPNTHDLRVWWISAETGDLLDERAFAASSDEDKFNTRDEVARGVAVVGDEIVVVGERQVLDFENQLVRRTVVLRHDLKNEPLAEWTSPGELMDEDAGMAVGPLRAGGFVVTGWGRDKNSIRQVMTRWFSAVGESIAMRLEPTPTNDAVGLAVGEDREGKIVIAGTLQQPQTDTNAWIFAIPGPMGAAAWEVVRNGPGQGPDEAAGLAVDAWGYVYVAGSEFDGLQPRAFALRLYP
ncbi:hypothetical protein OV203_07820 [Nannocystis sp. ILAH1]|uniref:hypothetical protein n=1 Tax=Nannocystis sp. ILAH1 TaxID=2996789 RepID=UPI002271CF4B|nr:hypothetical protein [Nannocystis sp. ILAH1]MCY0987025.1 hypothetical protein [Nannocystis sp. ILAH1]